ncbi:MAG: 8-amino-7-oxononanoate synthase [Deltaproteobacteria bacterium]|nr:8-amino-7-oxononanoate synthase [Deltaproteobacteria bacterium]
MADFIEQRLEEIRSRNLYRELKVVDGEQDATIVLNGREVLNLSSNNYLGLANHPALKEAAREALDRHGCGSGASRLISGNMTAHEELEQRLARFKGTEAALVFNSGYQANVGIIATLVEKDDVVLSDHLNHASIIDGCRLSRATVSVYRHCDMDHLEDLLKKAPAKARKLIATESVFSMDGDIAPLRELVELAERHGATVMVDEAHGTGVRGPNGAGVVAEMGLGDRVLVQMGTLGKALGAFGAYVAGGSKLKELLINRARSFIFTTSLPPVVLAMAGAAVDLVEKEPERQCALRRNTERLRNGLERLGYTVGGSTQIIPVMVGEEQPCMELAARLLDSGFYVQGIRPPTVPPGTSRLRVTTMATHTNEQLDRALDAFARNSPHERKRA